MSKHPFVRIVLLLGLLSAAAVAQPARVLFVRGGPGSGGFLSGGSDAHLSDINDTSTGSGNTGFGELNALLTAEGFLVQQAIEGPAPNPTPLDLASLGLGDFDIVVFCSNNADYSAADAELIRQYVCGGGAALFISDANWGQTWSDAPDSDQSFLTPFDLIMNQDGGTYVVSRGAGDFVIGGQDMGGHPILAGPDGIPNSADDVDDFDGEGVSPLTITQLLQGVEPLVLARAKGQVHRNDNSGDGSGSSSAATDADGSLVVLGYGSGRVAGHFDRNTFFNDNGAGTSLHRYDNTQYAKNLFAWLRAADGPAFGAGCAGSGGFTPNLTLTGCPRPGAAVTLSIDQALGGAGALLLFGTGAAAGTLPGGCPLLLAGILPLAVSLPLGGTGPGGGSVSIATGVPGNAAPGTIALQAIVFDPQGQGGIAASNGLGVTIF